MIKVISENCELVNAVEGKYLVITSCEAVNSVAVLEVWDLEQSKKILADDSAEFLKLITSKNEVSYRRTIQGDCSVPRQKKACLEKLLKTAGLPLTQPETCLKKTTEFFPEATSYLSFEVSVDLLTGKREASKHAAVTCWQSS